MPTYSYYCSDCKEKWNVFHGMDEKEEKCSSCHSQNVKRLFNTVSAGIKSDASAQNEKEQIRSRVEKHIEEARNDLKERLLETRKDYKP